MSSLFISSRGGSSTKKVTKLTEFSELNFTRTIFIDFMKEISKLFLSGSESHSSHDFPKIISRQELLLFGVKEIKTNLETLDFINLKIGHFIDLLKVDISVRISSTHDEKLCELAYLTADEFL